ncbi:peroxisomal catalase 1-like [Brevipalpus obovatus]|uniref:peroxisomal catalase 1-like n=1 Tax=Brevipalpus obovatus TaxID=246614 RepID=UPI003D9EBBC1
MYLSSSFFLSIFCLASLRTSMTYEYSEYIQQLLLESPPLNESISDEMQFDDYNDVEGEEDVTTKESIGKNPYYTTASGKIVPDPYHVRTAGYYGPVLLEDFPFRQQIGHFDRERIPERVVHARGAGAFGYFECTNPEAHKLTAMTVFEKVGKKIPVAARISTSHGSMGSPDIKFDLKGFAVKFYTDDGNWDLTMLSAPAFFIRDPIMIPNVVHSGRADPRSGAFSYDKFWDFLTLMPESLLGVTMMFAGAGSAKNYRHVSGFTVNTYKLINKHNQMWFVRFNMEPDQGRKNMTIEELQKLNSKDTDYATRDLYNSIKKGNYPSWTLYAQILSPEKMSKLSFNALDTTKEWPEDLIKPIEFGRMVLKETPENNFAQIEQLAFNPSNTIPGIDISFDKMLQGRTFAYQDSQFYRLGVNYYSLPVNKPKAKVVSPNIRDGQSQFEWNYGDLPDYIPNSKINIRRGKPAKYTLTSPTTKIEVTRYNTDDDDNFSQVKDYWNRADEDTRWLLIHNMGLHLSKAKEELQERWLDLVKKASKEYYEKLKKELKKQNEARIDDEL